MVNFSRMPLLRLLVVLALFFPGIAHADDQRQEYVRVTYYHLLGQMRDGATVHRGAAACSSGRPGSGSLAFPMGTVLEFNDGRQVTCEDTGNGDYYWKGWVDVWTPSGTLGYKDFEWVTVICWGWCEDADAERSVVAN